MKRRTILPEVPGIPNGSAPLSETYRPNEIYRVTLTGIFVNILLSAGKLIAGILGRSGAMLADAIHSISDFATDIIVLLSVNTTPTATKEEKPRYEYGKHETVVTVLIGLALLGVAIVIFVDSAHRISSILSGTAFQRPGLIAVVAAAVSIAAKEWLYRYTLRTGRRVKSRAVIANAWHHRSDALSSIGSFIGILGARMGYPVLDPLASVIICLMIVYASYEIFKDAVDKMVDRSCDAATINTMTALIKAQKGVDHIDVLQTRKFGSRIYVDVEVSADDNLTLLEAHTIAENIHKAIERNFSEVKHCMVHVNPCSEIHHD